MDAQILAKVLITVAFFLTIATTILYWLVTCSERPERWLIPFVFSVVVTVVMVTVGFLLLVWKVW